MNPQLSILICTILDRFESSAEIMGSLRAQSEGKPVEIISILDNRLMKVGKKRNELLSMASGAYVCFVDDDDTISPDYVDSILSAIETGEDVIVFPLLRRHNGIEDRICYYSKDYEKDRDTPDAYYRIPNHLMVFRSEIAKAVKYAERFYGEDSEWAREIHSIVKTERKIDKILYTYESSDTGSATRPHYLVSIVIHTNWKTAAPIFFIEYAQDLSCIAEILIFSENDPPNELNYEKVKFQKVDKFDWNQSVGACKSTKVCILDSDCVLDRYAFHMASGALEDDNVKLVGLDESCVERGENSLEKSDSLNPLYGKALFIKKALFTYRHSDQTLTEQLFDLYSNYAYKIKGPKIFEI
jgi:glycosyltransferase involved in cell wall biosynthesis